MNNVSFFDLFSGDVGNALIETVGGLFIWLSVKKILHDREVKGFSIFPMLFFTSWGIWNLWYYQHVGQWISGYAAFMPALANATYIFLMVKYIRHPDPPARNLS